MPAAIERLCDRAEAAVAGGYNIIILSDRQIGPDRIDIPTLLATAAVHHHLIRKGLRTSVGLVVESGEPREVHHFCCLAGYGAEAINPYLAFDTLHRHAQARRAAGGGRRLRGRLALHQVDRQGHPQGDVQDGHLDLPVLLRRADFRRHRAEVGFRRKVFHRHRDDDRGRRAGGDRRRKRSAATPTRSATIRCCATRSRSAANICSACAAKPISGRPMRSPRLQHAVRKGIVGDLQGVFRADRQRNRARADHPRPVQDQDGRGNRPQAGRRSKRSCRPPTSSSGSRPARCRSARSRARRIRRWRAR